MGNRYAEVFRAKILRGSSARGFSSFQVIRWKRDWALSQSPNEPWVSVRKTAALPAAIPRCAPGSWLHHKTQLADNRSQMHRDRRSAEPRQQTPFPWSLSWSLTGAAEPGWTGSGCRVLLCFRPGFRSCPPCGLRTMATRVAIRSDMLISERHDGDGTRHGMA